MTNSESAAVVLDCWKRILDEAAKVSKRKDEILAAYSNVQNHFLQHPQQLEYHRYGHLSPSLKKKISGVFAKSFKRLFRPLPQQLEKDFETVLGYITRRSLGRPSLEDRYAVFYDVEQLNESESLFHKWGEVWKKALNYNLNRRTPMQDAAALRAGIIIGYTIQSHKDRKTLNVPLRGQTERINVIVDDIITHIETTSPALTQFLSRLLEKITPALKTSEDYLVRYKVRNIASALTTSILLSVPFVVLGYVLDFYVLPTLVAAGLAGFFWKASEIVIRYLQGSLDTVIQFYQIKKETKEGGVCRDDCNAAKWGVRASFVGPLVAILAPKFGILETSRWYAAVAIINATIDNLASALRKALTNWANAAALHKDIMERCKRVLKDPYVSGNLIGAALIFFIDVSGRALVSPTMFEFLRIVAVEGLIIGMLDSEIAALLSRILIEHQNHKWQKLLNETTFEKVYKENRVQFKNGCTINGVAQAVANNIPVMIQAHSHTTELLA